MLASMALTVLLVSWWSLREMAARRQQTTPAAVAHSAEPSKALSPARVALAPPSSAPAPTVAVPAPTYIAMPDDGPSHTDMWIIAGIVVLAAIALAVAWAIRNRHQLVTQGVVVQPMAPTVNQPGAPATTQPLAPGTTVAGAQVTTTVANTHRVPSPNTGHFIGHHP